MENEARVQRDAPALQLAHKLGFVFIPVVLKGSSAPVKVGWFIQLYYKPVLRVLTVSLTTPAHTIFEHTTQHTVCKVTRLSSPNSPPSKRTHRGSLCKPRDARKVLAISVVLDATKRLRRLSTSAAAMRVHVGVVPRNENVVAGVFEPSSAVRII